MTVLLLIISLVLTIIVLYQRTKIKMLTNGCIQICVRHANERREWMEKEMQYLNEMSDLNMQIPCD